MALVEHRDAVADRLDDLHLVRDDHDGHAQLAVDPAQKLENLARRVRVERGGRLVAEQYLRVGRQCARDGHALLLAARELARIGLHALAQAHQLEQLLRPRDGLGLRHARDLHRIADVPQRVALGEQVEVLKDHADGAARGQKLLLGHLHQIAAVEHHAALRGRLQKVHAAQKGGFSGAGGSDNADNGSLFHIEIDALQHMVAAEGFVQVANFNH